MINDYYKNRLGLLEKALTSSGDFKEFDIGLKLS